MEAQDTDNIEAATRAYAGPRYAEPRKVKVARFDFDDYTEIAEFTKAMQAFQKETEGLEVSLWKQETEYDSYAAGFIAYRQETPQEVETRIASYRLEIAERQSARRAEYARMKIEFGDA